MSRHTREIPPDFGRNLEARMHGKNWNQSDLARAAGVGRDSISTYIRGLVMPDPKNLVRLADALGCTVPDLLPERATELPEKASFELRQTDEGVFVRINKPVTIEQAAKIFDILRQ